MTLRNPNDFQTFYDLVATNSLEPSASNLYELSIPAPTIMWTSGQRSFLLNTRIVANFFATSVSFPTRVVTTGSVYNYGMNRRVATGQTSSSFSISFMVTKNNSLREFFETWMHLSASDSDNTVAFYDDYVTDIDIIKWEKGSNTKLSTEQSNLYRTANKTLSQTTAICKVFGVYPINISSQILTNDKMYIMEITINFYYERYVFDTIMVDNLRHRRRANVYNMTDLNLVDSQNSASSFSV